MSAPISKPTSKRILYFDLLTIVAGFAVVCLHCNAQVHNYYAAPSWYQSLAMETIFYFAVPVFFMLTGANNMGYRAKYDTKTFLLRRLKKLVIPFVAWSIIVYLANLAAHNYDAPGLMDFWTRFISCNIETIYWFFPAIIGITLCMPILSLLHGKKKLCGYLVGVWFVLVTVLPYLFKAIGLPWTGSFYPVVASSYVGYVVLGYLLANIDVPKKWRILIYVLAILCLVLRYVHIFTMSQAAGETTSNLSSYLCFASVIPSVAVFLIFKHAKWPRVLEQHSGAITKISSCAFGVYLMHRLVLLAFITVTGLTWASAIIRFALPIPLFVFCILVTLVMKKIPLVKEIVP